IDRKIQILRPPHSLTSLQFLSLLSNSYSSTLSTDMNSSSAATKQAWKAALEKAIVKHGGPQVMDKLMDRCVDQGCVDGMQALVDRGCKVYKDHLYAAATPGHLGAVEFICNFFKDMPKSEQKAHHERHVDDDEDDYNSAGTCLFEWIVDGTSAFDSAIEMGHFEVVKYIIKCYGGGLPVADMNVWAYQTAFEHKHYEMGIYLCDFEQKHVDEDLDEDDEEDSCYEGFWPFYYIVETEFDPALFQILIDRKLLGVDDVSTLGNTMLHLACRLNNKKMLDLFLEAGADVCTKNSDGKSPV
ncbi:unnamed protein product, partial [Ectocarpus sp. 8 AP-2014]